MTITVASRKAKARTLQNKVAADIRSLYPVLDGDDIRPAIMGESGIDIKLSNHARQFFPWGVECKCQECINVWTSFEQAENNAKIEKTVRPLLVFKRNRSETYVMMKWSDFLLLQKEVKK